MLWSAGRRRQAPSACSRNVILEMWPLEGERIVVWQTLPYRSSLGGSPRTPSPSPMMRLLSSEFLYRVASSTLSTLRILPLNGKMAWETAVTGLLCTAAYRSNVLLSALDAEHKLHVRLRGNPGHMPLGILVNSVSGQPHIGVGPAIRRTAELLHSSRSQGKGRPQLPRPSSLNLKGGKGGGGGGFWQ